MLGIRHWKICINNNDMLNALPVNEWEICEQFHTNASSIYSTENLPRSQHVAS